MIGRYRAYEIKTIVLIHEGQEIERDTVILSSLADDIRKTCTGDVIIVTATPIVGPASPGDEF